MTAALIALGVAVVLLGVLVATALRHRGAWARVFAGLAGTARTGRRPPPPRRPLVGTAAGGIDGPDPAGQPDERRWTAADRTLVAFLTGGCRTCQTFWTALNDPARSVEAGLSILVVTPSPTTESRRGIAARTGDGLSVIMSSEAWMTYGVRGAPWFVVIDGGTIEAEGTVGSWPELVAMARPRGSPSDSDRTH